MSLQHLILLVKKDLIAFRKNNYSEDYIKNIQTYISDLSEPPQGAFVKSEAMVNSVFPRYNWNKTAGNYLAYMNEDVVPVLSSDFELKTDTVDISLKRRLLISRNTGVFYQFVKDQKENKTFESIEKSKEDFADKYSIDFLIALKGADIPVFIQNRIVKEFTDSISGERFIVFKKNSKGSS